MADRIPVFCNLLDQGARELGLPLNEYYSRGEYVAEGQLRLQKKYGYDNVWCLFYVGKEAELFGCRKIIFAEDGPPNVGEMILETYDDVYRLQVPEDVTSHPAFEETRKCLDILKREVGGKRPICAYVTASMTLPAILMGMENWLALLLSGPLDVRDELLEKCSEFFRKQVAALRNAGADIILYSNPFGSVDFLPMRMFEMLSLPWMERDLKPVGADGVVYYCGGARLIPVIDRVIERTGIGAYYLSPLESVAAGKRAIEGRALCAGVINDIRMIDWSPQEVREEVKRILAEGMPGGRFMFGTVVMPWSIPDANIRAMLEAAFEFGRLQ
ncbi:MAG: uroporphyrinogen decarboxylase family protein [Candidatus Hydrogenedentes bacterium]|nr:uroporphyrinogen decarboxylase family protein [Candidatus Hydrogenedentota bacterium]